MTARATFEAGCWAALAKHKQAIADGTWQRTADNSLVDAVLKAADAYLLAAIEKAAEYGGTTPAERRIALRQARSDIGRQPANGTARLG